MYFITVQIKIIQCKCGRSITTHTKLSLLDLKHIAQLLNDMTVISGHLVFQKA